MANTLTWNGFLSIGGNTLSAIELVWNNGTTDTRKYVCPIQTFTIDLNISAGQVTLKNGDLSIASYDASNVTSLTGYSTVSELYADFITIYS